MSVWGNNSKAKAVRQDLTKERLFFFMVKYNMNKSNLAKRYGVSTDTIDAIIKEQGFNLIEEKEKYMKEVS